MSPDNFWLRAMRHAYEDSASDHLSAIEQAGLLPLCIQHSANLQDDRWWACAVDLREDGAGVIAPLTLARLDAYLVDYWDGGRTPSFSVKP